MGVLMLVVSILAIVMRWLGHASWLESVSFVTGALCVWLTVKQSIWNFPVGLVNVATFCVVFFQAGLFADAGLQVLYFVLGVIGWYLWLRGGERHSELRVSRASGHELILLILLGVGGTLAMWQLLRFGGGSASFWDALTTAISLIAQWLLNRKKLENWMAWIVVDIIYVPLYLYKELYLTSLLYAVFLVMAFMGLRAWHQSWVRERHSAAMV